MKTINEDSSQILVLRDNAKRELLQIQTVEDGITYLNKLKSIETWVRAEKQDAELSNIIAEQKLRTQRILGELIEDGQRKGIIATGRDNLKNGSEVSERNFGKDSLEDIGLTKKQSSTFQAIASIPEKTFEEFIQEKKEAVNGAVAELTTAGAVRLAKSLQERKEDQKILEGMGDTISVESEIRELARHINSSYTVEQKALLVSLIK